jgi:outer membrane protein assembly factor BamD (BamD/ComL family)
VRFDFRLVLLSMLMMQITGCATILETETSKQVEVVKPNVSDLAKSLELLGAGNEKAAREYLERAVNAAPLAGVTDEAIFRLAMLSLRDENGRGGQNAINLLERLKAEYPHSIWTRQAAPLMLFLTSSKTCRDKQREVKVCKEQNFALTRENRELRMTIERLKSQDIELEKKYRYRR